MINSDLDFKLLSVFQALLETKQVSAAAERLGMPQPSVSRALAKLRKHFGDPLFVRTQYSMELCTYSIFNGAYAVGHFAFQHRR